MILTGPESTLDLGCSSFPMTPDLQAVQGTEITGGGFEHIEDYVTTKYVLGYTYNRMPKTTWDLLFSFFLNEVRARLYEFDVVDDYGESYRGRFAESSLPRGKIYLGVRDEFYWQGEIMIQNMDIIGTGSGDGNGGDG